MIPRKRITKIRDRLRRDMAKAARSREEARTRIRASAYEIANCRRRKEEVIF